MTGHDPNSEGNEAREARLRQLLSEAVEPVQPEPGAQARLLAKARAQSRGREPGRAATRLRWAGAALGATAVVAGVVFVAVNTHGESDSQSSSGVSSATVGSAAPSTAGAQVPGAPTAASPEAAAANGAGKSAADAQLSTRSRLGPGVVPADLDGDGRADVFSLAADVLTAQLSTAGRQLVTLAGIGPGAQLIGVRTINASGQQVVVVKLRSGPPAEYAELGLANGRLTLLGTTTTPPPA